jgi:hypothetical protein
MSMIKRVETLAVQPAAETGDDCGGTCAIHRSTIPATPDTAINTRLSECEIDELKELLEDAKRNPVFIKRVMDAVSSPPTKATQDEFH